MNVIGSFKIKGKDNTGNVCHQKFITVKDEEKGFVLVIHKITMIRLQDVCNYVNLGSKIIGERFGKAIVYDGYSIRLDTLNTAMGRISKIVSKYK